MLLILPQARPFALQVPKLPVGVEDQPLAILGEVFERALVTKILVGRPSPAQRMAAFCSERVLAHGQVEVLPGLFLREGTREHRGVAFGGHAAVIVVSDVAGYFLGQQPLAPVPKAHARIVRPDTRQERGAGDPAPRRSLRADSYLRSCPFSSAISVRGSSSASLNCISSVEPVRAVVEAMPPATT